MEAFNNTNPLWDLSLPQALPVADEEFLALLQKQFGVSDEVISRNYNFSAGKTEIPSLGNIDPQSLTRFPPPPTDSTPTSEDSSPSPPSFNDVQSTSRSRRESGVYADASSSGARKNDKADDDDHAPKRKASFDDSDDEPTHKSQHTSSSKKTPNNSRRKSTGNTGDESRLLKRKEQNRAAQRAFRERKEKHVKDLEDKLAALEDKNNVAVKENESLREVVSRLQSENVRLRQSSFTFAVPQTNSEQPPPPSTEASRSPPAEVQQGSSMNLFNSPLSATSSTSASSHDSPQSLFLNDKSESPLSFFGQGLTVIDPEPQQTATASADAMAMDFGFGPIPTHTPYTTIASNPLFMSFREPDPYSTVDQANQNQPFTQINGVQPFNYSQQSYAGWPDVNMDNSGVGLQAFDLTNSLDELFGGASYIGPPGLDYSGFGKASPSTSLSPIQHQTSARSQTSISSGSSSSGSSPESIQPNGGSQATQMGGGSSCSGAGSGKCTKADLANAVAHDQGSMFAPKASPMSPLSSSEASTPAQTPGSTGAPADENCKEFPPCKGLQLPKTQKSEKNVEVMDAWRTIRHDPQYQDVNINQLCSEFASKARCDGSQVVIEPSGMQEILDTVAKARMAKQQGMPGVGNNSANVVTN